MGYVETVLGRIADDKLGLTLMHEHLWSDLCYIPNAREPKDPEKKKLMDMPVTLENLGVLRRNLHFCRDNLRLNSEPDMAAEALEFKKAGGSTIVDLTTIDIDRNIFALRRIAELSGVNILTSTGNYRYYMLPTYVLKASVEQLVEIYVSEITEGIGNSGIKAGIIGEIGASSPRPYHEQEKKTMQAASRAQVKTGAALTFHQEYIRNDFKSDKIQEKAYEHYLDIIEKEGVNKDKFYLSHTQFTYFDLDYQSRILDRGVTLEYDCFGMEYYYEYGLNAVPIAGVKDMPIGAREPQGMTDTERVKCIAELCSRGYEKNLLLSHDICHKTELKKYGGHGYSHIPAVIVPWLKQEGVNDKQIRTMLIDNPRRILAR